MFLNFSCRGEPGIGFDYEFALRTWYLGYHVGVFKSEMDYHVGGESAVVGGGYHTLILGSDGSQRTHSFLFCFVR